jgi:hypothetical protein
MSAAEFLKEGCFQIRCFITKQGFIHESDNLSGTNVKMPYVLVGDDTLLLKENVMKPLGYRFCIRRKRFIMVSSI